MDNAPDYAENLIQQIKDSTPTFRKHQCRHTMPEGERCGSPAMNGEKYCYHHHQTRRPIADASQRRARRNAFGMPTPNSRAEIQDSIGRIISRVAGNDIDLRRAGLLLYALQLASTNLTEHQRHPKRTQLEAEPAQPEHPHYGAGPRPQFAPNGEPISTIQTTTEQSKDSAPDFTPPPAKWHRLQQGTGRLLLEQLGRHHSGDNPLPGSPEDRRNSTYVSLQASATTHEASFRAKRRAPAFLSRTSDAPQPFGCPNAKSTNTSLKHAAKTKAHTNTSPATPQRSRNRTPSSSPPQTEPTATPTRRSPHRSSVRGQWRGKGQTESPAAALLHRSPTHTAPRQQKRKEPTSHRFASPSPALGSTTQPTGRPPHKAQTGARARFYKTTNETPGLA